jgi:hypothetical protein
MSSIIKVDTIDEKTPTSGVTIDGVLVKDGEVDGVDVSAITQGITIADTWRLTANVSNTINYITTNLERVDDASFGYVGTGMTESSGTFSFPSTGIYMITLHASCTTRSIGDNNTFLRVSTDNFTSYDDVIRLDGDNANSSDINYVSSGTTFVDVTDTSNVKVRIYVDQRATTATLMGNTDINRSSITFIRLGNT